MKDWKIINFYDQYENKKMRKYIYFFMAIFPIVMHLFLYIFRDVGLIFWGLESLYYYPVCMIAKPMCYFGEMGLVDPTVGGRLLAFLLYFLFLFLLFSLKDKLFKSN